MIAKQFSKPVNVSADLAVWQCGGMSLAGHEESSVLFEGCKPGAALDDVARFDLECAQGETCLQLKRTEAILQGLARVALRLRLASAIRPEAASTRAAMIATCKRFSRFWLCTT